jgi:hypothetical protein
MHIRVVTAAILTLAGCASDRAVPVRPDAAIAMDNLETRLLEAGRVSIEFHVTAEGAFQADIEGTLTFIDDETNLHATGTFGGDPVDLVLQTEGPDLKYGNGPNLLSTVTPVHLREAVLLGLTRMGILHSLARLTANQAPDHADGGVADWVVLDQVRWEESSGSDLVRFALIVEGQPGGTATIEVDQDGLPVLRRQTTVFSEGEMTVVERYSDITLD